MIYDSLVIILKGNYKNRNTDRITDMSHMSTDVSYVKKKHIIQYLIIDHFYH